jgi:hypothetical protein
MRECRRAENADYNIAALRKLTDRSIERATLIVETARSAATTEMPALSKHPAKDVDVLFAASAAPPCKAVDRVDRSPHERSVMREHATRKKQAVLF